MKKTEIWSKPIRLVPNCIATPWAGTRMKKYREHIGEGIGTIREVCAYKTFSNRILTQPHQGELLRDVLDVHATDILGEGVGNQMIRLAYIDAMEDLSLQVHPDDAYAKAYENDFEKAEAWYILDCSEDAYVIAGTTLQTKEELYTSIQDGSVMSHMLHLPVQPNDVVMVPSHLIHACGGNILALEISSFGGITYRLYDYGRGRELHLDAGLKNLDLNLRADIRHVPFRFADRTERKTVVQHPLFHVDVLDVHDYAAISKTRQYQIVTSVHGNFKLRIDDAEHSLNVSETLIIPAAITSFEVYGKGRLLLSYQP